MSARETLVLLFLTAAPAEATACFLGARPEPAELIMSADDIVVAVAEEDTIDVFMADDNDIGRAPFFRVDMGAARLADMSLGWLERLWEWRRVESVTFRRLSIKRVLKGTRFASKDKIFVLEEPRDTFESRVEYSTPYKNRRPIGSRCYPMTYRTSHEYLLIMFDGVLYGPDGPTNEETRGVGDPWVEWVERKISQQEE